MSALSALPIVFTTAQGQKCPDFVHPPLDGSMFVNEMIDWHIQHSKDHLYAKFIAAGDEDGGQITYLQLGRLVHTLARQLLDTISGGPADESGKPRIVTILTSVDAFTYCVTILALLRAGFQPFPLSPKNSAPALVHLITSTSSNVLIGSIPVPEHVSSPLERTTQEVLTELEKSRYPLKLVLPPRPLDLFSSIQDNKPVDLLPPLPSLPSFSNANSNPEWPCIILHSSGSTKFPKPIYLNQQATLEWYNSYWMGETDIGGEIFGAMASPTFHAMGVASQLGAPFACGAVIALFKPTDHPLIPTADVYLDALVRSRSTITTAFPTFIEEWSESQEAMKKLCQLDILAFGGGPLAQHAGDKMVSAGVKLRVLYGSTESGFLFRNFLAEPLGKDWQYGKLPVSVNARFIPDDSGNAVLQVFECASSHPSVFNVPGERGYDTHDLMQEHPTKKGFYRVVGRSDDQIIMANGEKTNPGPLESIITADPNVQGVVIFGRSRNQVGVAVEPAYPVDLSNDKEIEKFRNAIWPFIEAANKFAPTHSRIFKEYILICDPVNKPFHRTSKGLVARNPVLTSYATEIDAIYDNVEKAITSDWAQPPEKWDEDGLRAFVARIISGTIGGDGAPMDREGDLFAQGCDSLQATHIRNALIHGLRQVSAETTAAQPHTKISHNIVFEHPTQKALEDFIVHLIFDDELTVSGAARLSSADSDAEHVKAMLDMISKYTSDFPAHSPLKDTPAGHSGEVILLTGSTGALGSYLLGYLLNDPRVSKVYALNRRTKGTGMISVLERQKVAFQDRGLDVGLLSDPKLIMVEGDATHSNLGLDQRTYETIQNTITSIIHTAWRLDFNLTLQSFEPHVRGIRDLVDLSLKSPRAKAPRIIFTSSIGTLGGWNKDTAVPEEAIDDPRVALGNGYGESKWVSERILLEAARQRGLSITNLRIGQLSGSRVNGAWNITDWVPHIIQTGKILGILPIFPPDTVVAWLPVDVAAASIVDILFSETPNQYLHLVHPHPTPWNAILSAVTTILNKDHLTPGRQPKPNPIHIQLVPYAQWFSTLESLSTNSNSDSSVNITHIKALSLLDFLRAGIHSDDTGASGTHMHREAMGLALLQTTKTRAVSDTLAQVGVLDDGDTVKWLEYWGGRGLFV